MSQNTSNFTRRRFLTTSLSAASLPTIISASALGGVNGVAPSAKLTIGVVGLGSRGFNLIDELLKQKDAQIVAVCDVSELHHRDRPWGTGSQFGRQAAKAKIDKHYQSSKGIEVTDDYRKLCSSDEIDAIVVATPDHWHALCTLEAIRNNKDVYCEKPVTHTFHEGQLVYREAVKHDAVFQTGSQQRSDRLFRRAVELVRNGHLGEITKVEVGLPPGYDKPMGDVAVGKPPKRLDYETWCGPSQRLPYMRARHHRWWRGHRAYGGGVLMDWIGHHNDIAHWALNLDNSGPTKVEAIGWTFPESDVYNTPHHYEIRCEYGSKVSGSISSRNLHGTKLIGEKGWVHVTRGRIKASNPLWTKNEFQPGDKEVYTSNNHMLNFLECVKSRQQCICPAETAHRSITPGHLAYVSHELGRGLQWDAKSETVVDDRQANELLQNHNYREHWQL
jgi:predicted dehydrogenase